MRTRTYTTRIHLKRLKYYSILLTLQYVFISNTLYFWPPRTQNANNPIWDKKEGKVKSPGLHEIRYEMRTLPGLSPDSPQLTFEGLTNHDTHLSHNSTYFSLV